MTPKELGIEHSERLWIGGTWRPAHSGRLMHLVSPNTEEVFASVAEADALDMDAAVAAARTAFETGPWSRMNAAGRIAALERMSQHLHGREGAREFLLEVDAYLQQLQARVHERVGRALKIDIVSDHGSTMMPSQVVPVQDAFEACGFRRNMKMEGERDVAFALPGIVGSMAISVRPSQLEDAAKCLAPLEGVDLVAVNRGDAVGVVSADGEAEVRQLRTAPERYGYRALRGDPLGLLALQPGPGTSREFDQDTLFALTRDGERHDGGVPMRPERERHVEPHGAGARGHGHDRVNCNANACVATRSRMRLLAYFRLNSPPTMRLITPVASTPSTPTSAS